MDHAIVNLPELHLIGMGVDCPQSDTSGIAPLWERCMQRWDELPGEHCAWGVCVEVPGGFRYYCALRVDAAMNPPQDFESLTIPASKYLQVRFRGTPDRIGPEFGRIFQELMPELGLSIRPGLTCLEEYLHDESDEKPEQLRANLYVQML